MMTLQLPPGANEYPIAHDTQSYQPYRADRTDPTSAWLIDVPEEVAVHLLHVGGFSVAKPKAGPAAKPGDLEYRVTEPGEGQTEALAQMRHAEGIGCSFAGQSFEPDADGVVRVPHAAVADLMAHGFLLWPPLPPAPEPPPPSIADDVRRAPVVPRRDWPTDAPGTPHPETRR